MTNNNISNLAPAFNNQDAMNFSQDLQNAVTRRITKNIINYTIDFGTINNGQIATTVNLVSDTPNIEITYLDVIFPTTNNIGTIVYLNCQVLVRVLNLVTINEVRNNFQNSTIMFIYAKIDDFTARWQQINLNYLNNVITQTYTITPTTYNFNLGIVATLNNSSVSTFTASTAASGQNTITLNSTFLTNTNILKIGTIIAPFKTTSTDGTLPYGSSAASNVYPPIYIVSAISTTNNISTITLSTNISTDPYNIGTAIDYNSTNSFVWACYGCAVDIPATAQKIKICARKLSSDNSANYSCLMSRFYDSTGAISNHTSFMDSENISTNTTFVQNTNNTTNYVRTVRAFDSDGIALCGNINNSNFLGALFGEFNFINSYITYEGYSVGDIGMIRNTQESTQLQTESKTILTGNVSLQNRTPTKLYFYSKRSAFNNDNTTSIGSYFDNLTNFTDERYNTLIPKLFIEIDSKT